MINLLPSKKEKAEMATRKVQAIEATPENRDTFVDAIIKGFCRPVKTRYFAKIESISIND